ncbi:MAG: hypothetical protein HY866_13115 [Chloroflexi bacterium]|nr:hypothetical protein [Chloroflexota bacterium]
MDPVLALAIVSLGAFAITLITAIFYVSAVRKQILDPVPQISGGIGEELREELDGQRAAIERLHESLVHHTEQLALAANRAAPGDIPADLRGVMSAQTDTSYTLLRLMREQRDQFAGFDARLIRQDEKLERLSSAFDSRLNAPGYESLTSLIQAQADKLVTIGARLEQWGAEGLRRDEKLTEHARILAELDRELAEQAQAAQILDSKVSEHTTMLVTAATERREQTGLLERLLQQIGQMAPILSRAAAPTPRPGQDRLTDIKGIGPVYASKLYEAGVQTFRQLAAMTPDEIYLLLNEPAWRVKVVKAQSWIEQAQMFAAQREKVEQIK